MTDLRLRILGDSTGAERALSTVSGRLGGLAAAGAAAFAGSKLVGFLGDSVGAASDLNETLSKSSVIFGQNAAAVQQWAAGSDRAFGLSKQAALESASSFGDMFSQIGITGDKATGLSEKVVQMAADFGSFNNLPTTDVLDRIAGGFRGEYDALQKIIPNISAARVQQEALNETHKASASDLTAADKALATFNILQQDGSRAMGDFARTSGGLANQQKITNAEWQNAKAKLGGELMPAMVGFEHFMSGTLIPAFSGLIDFMHRNGSEIKFVGETLAVTWAVFKGYTIIRNVTIAMQGFNLQMALMRTFGGNAATFGSLMGQFAKGGAIIGGVTVAVGLAIQAWNHHREAQEKARAIAKSYADALKQDNDAIGANVRLMAAKNLEDIGALKSAEQLGVSTQTVVDATLGDADAKRQLAAAYGPLIAAQQALAASAPDNLNDPDWQAKRDAIESQVDAYKKLMGVVGGQNSAINDQIASDKRLASASGDVTGAVNKTTGATKDVTGAMKDTVSAADAVRNAFDKLTGANQSVDATDIRYRNDLDKLTDTLQQNGTTIDLNTQAGRDNRSAILDLVKEAQDHAEAVYKQTGSLDAANSVLGQHENQIRGVLTQLGYNKTDIDNLIKSYGGLPKDVTTNVEADTGGAVWSLSQLQSYYASVKNTIESQAINIHAEMAGARNATGTGWFKGGLTTLNEYGEELVALPQGSRVYSAGQSERIRKEMAATPTGGDIVIKVAFNGPVLGAADVQQWLIGQIEEAANHGQTINALKALR